MLLRHEDVRHAAKDWETYSSDAPFRVPIPSEGDVRSMRQLPIETNPPEHTDYRAIVEPFFQRARDPGVIAEVEALIDRSLTHALNRQSIEIAQRRVTAANALSKARSNLRQTEMGLKIQPGLTLASITSAKSA